MEQQQFVVSVQQFYGNGMRLLNELNGVEEVGEFMASARQINATINVCVVCLCVYGAVH